MSQMPLENRPDLWKGLLPRKKPEDHKYSHGHAVIYGAPELTGATRLAAESCARMGAGLVTVLSIAERADVYRRTLAPHILVRDDLNWWDERVTAVLWGSGGSPAPVALRAGIAAVLDADALAKLPSGLNEDCILTPHEGEFARAFPDIQGSREEKAAAAARSSGAIIVLKGAETLVAHPDGRMAVNTHASPHLATAGTGDVLAGMITGLLAQKMPGFEAACAAVWIHGECALRLGPGLVAGDLSGQIPEMLKEFS